MDLDDLYRQLNRTRALEELDEVRMRKHAAVSKTQLRGDIDRLRTSLAHAGPRERERLEESIHNMENDMRKFDGLPPLVRKTKPTSQELAARIAPKISWAQARPLRPKALPAPQAPKALPKALPTPKAPKAPLSPNVTVVSWPKAKPLARPDLTAELIKEIEKVQQAYPKSVKVTLVRPQESFKRKPGQTSLDPFAKTQSKSSSSKK
jgi:hypothetical protein